MAVSKGKEQHSPLVYNFLLFKLSPNLTTNIQQSNGPNLVTFKLHTSPHFVYCTVHCVSSVFNYTIINLKYHIRMNQIILVKLKIHFLIMYLHICQTAVLLDLCISTEHTRLENFQRLVKDFINMIKDCAQLLPINHFYIKISLVLSISSI